MTLLLENLKLLLCMIGLFLLAYGTFIITSIAHGTKTLGETFEKDKFFEGIKKGGIIILSITLLTVIITIAPQVFLYAGLNDLAKTFSDGLNVVMIILMIGSITVKYAMESFSKLKYYIDNTLEPVSVSTADEPTDFEDFDQIDDLE